MHSPSFRSAPAAPFSPSPQSPRPHPPENSDLVKSNIESFRSGRSHKNNPRLDLTGVEFRAEAAMKFQAAIRLQLCLTLSAWSQLTFTVPVVDKSDPGS